MFLTVHAATGVLIAQHSKNGLIAFLLALISHYFLDFIPHGDKIFSKSKDPKYSRIFYRLLTFDTVFLGIFLVFIFLHPQIYKSREIVSWGIIGSILPDLSYPIGIVNKAKIIKAISKSNEFVHNIIKGDLSIKNGLILQMVIFTLLNFAIWFGSK